MKFQLYRAIPVLMAMLAFPAVAQFEVNPDHFDGSAAENPRISNARGRAEIKQQLAAQQARLTGYRKQIEKQVALVEEARQMLISPAVNTDRADATIALQARQRDLAALRQTLAGAIRYTKARIAAFKTELNAPAAAAPAIHPAIRSSGQSGGALAAMVR